MLGLLRSFEMLHDGVEVTEFEARRWVDLLSQYDEYDVHQACAVWIESWETADIFPTPENIIDTIHSLFPSPELVGEG